ncbi:MAG: hypothetical protein NTZ10_06625 [Candidatus Saganbacteria bacterium]|nr:hypothetical protein [Candidatus Saganbacteria bacterium]
MKKTLIVMLLIIITGFVAFRLSAGTNESEKKDFIMLNAQINRLLKEPKDGARSNFDIPIGIRILGCTPDRKWYKARISYNFLGYHEYEGWVKVE